MSDEVFPTPTRQIDIPARFIRQAMEHIEHAGSRYVTFLFTGEQVIDAICVGVTTRLLITDQRRAAAPAPTPPPSETTWTVATLTNDVILDQVRKYGSLTVRDLGNNLGIPGNAIPQRQRIRRVLQALVDERLLRKVIGVGFPAYALPGQRAKSMPVQPGRRTRRIQRKDVTEEKVMEIFLQRDGRACSRDIGDSLEIPRGDASVRGKISNVIHDLLMADRIRLTGESDEKGGRIYEVVNQTVAEA
jgi:hypothetical protein